MKFIDTPLKDVKLIEPQVFGDARGFFVETWQVEKFAAAGINATFVQDNHSHSAQWTLRGLHFQVQHTQGKLVRVTQGSVFDVMVDLRRSSPSLRYARFRTVISSSPRGEGFKALASAEARSSYK